MSTTSVRFSSRPLENNAGVGNSLGLCVALPNGGVLEALEYPFHPVHARDVVASLMVAAALAFSQPQSAPHVGLAGGRPTQMDHRGQFLNALGRCKFDAMVLQGAGHTAVEICRRKFHRMRRDYAR